MKGRLCAALILSLAAVAFGVAGCGQEPAMLIKVTADGPVEQYDLYIREDATGEIIFHSGFNPVLAPGEKPDDGSTTRDLTRDALRIAVKLSKGGKYTLLIVGVMGPVEGGKPGAGATQFFWAGHADIDGANEIDARLLTVPDGDDQDRDFWPDVTDFPAHVPEAAQLYAGQLDLLDCDDKTDNPLGPDGMPLSLRAETINPFAPEICGDGYDENCNGNADDPCVDADGDGDPKGDDCDDNDPARHKPNPKDPFPDPPNCCGYSLGFVGTDMESKDFTGDPILCPMKRCGDGIDESCRGNSVNDPSNDTACTIDADCDGYPAPPMGDDCDDTNPAIHPGAVEVCGDGVNQSCNILGPDAGCVPCDLDGDGYERQDSAANCPDNKDQHPGMVDCDDNDAGVHPGATSVAGGKEGGVNSQGKIATALRGLCRRYYEHTGLTGTPKINNGDADCNGVPYEGCPPPSCDADGDGWPVNDCGMGLSGPYDCNDNDPTIFPSAPDKCGDGIDSACAGADSSCNGMDADGDGYIAGVDCNDNDKNVFPFQVELCNGVDDDCDGDVDEGNPDPSGNPMVTAGVITQCTDSDIGECGKTKGSCVCSPTAPVTAINAASRMACPGETSGGPRVPHCFGAGQPTKQSCGDVLNVDDDCDGRFDDPAGTNLAVKGMPCGLSQGICKPGVVVGCVQTPSKTWYGATAPAGKSHWECSADTIPALTSELCNGFDDTCDGVLPPDEADPDMDKYMQCTGCAGLTLAGALLGCGDCDPNVGTTYPGAPEKCNGVDDNCSGQADETPNECSGMGKTCCYANGGVCQDLTGDTNYCGACNVTCAGKIFVNVCQASACICKNQGAACGARNWCDGSNNGGTCTLCNTTAHCGDLCTPCAGTNVCKTDGSGCTGCNSDADCDANNPPGTTYCQGGSCLPRKGAGGSCTAPSPDPNVPDDECLAANPYCTDGVCCDKPSNMCGGCSACNRTGSKGTCSFVQPSDTNPDPHNTCTYSLSGCSLASCNGTGSCYSGDGAACSSVSCVDNATESHTQELQCTGGSCGATQVMLASCGDYKCNGASCLTSCTADSQCQSGKPHCWLPSNGGDGHCYAKLVAGSTCAANSDCDSGACIGTKCCGMGTRPATCGTGNATTSCASGTNQLITYTCSGSTTPKYTGCTAATTSCGNGLNCSGDSVTCATTCTCSGAYPCYDPARGGDNSNCSTAGTRCLSMGAMVACTACNDTTACGATCVACTAMCTGQDTISGDACTGGTACALSHNCASHVACKANACVATCADDSDCDQTNSPGYWCRNDGTCQPRIASGSSCNGPEGMCKATVGTGANQCAVCQTATVGTGAVCGSNNKCP